MSTSCLHMPNDIKLDSLEDIFKFQFPLIHHGRDMRNSKPVYLGVTNNGDGFVISGTPVEITNSIPLLKKYQPYIQFSMIQGSCVEKIQLDKWQDCKLYDGYEEVICIEKYDKQKERFIKYIRNKYIIPGNKLIKEKNITHGLVKLKEGYQIFSNALIPRPKLAKFISDLEIRKKIKILKFTYCYLHNNYEDIDICQLICTYII